MRRILMSLMVIAVAVLAVVGGTFAKFAESTTSVENKFTAGNVSVSVNGAKSDAAIFTPENIKPGDTGTAVIHLQNVGSVRGCVFNMSVTKLASIPSSPALASKIDVVIWEENSSNLMQDSNEPSLYEGTLTHLKASDDIAFAKPDDTYVGFKWTFNESADEGYMNANCTANITFIARQP
jgi:predicted ribosomally synthesized peptide with SipW-like signal peptide